jgi:hypothetical protein
MISPLVIEASLTRELKNMPKSGIKITEEGKEVIVKYNDNI